MRGDSLRDLYAKVLAILGLGALAGVGALVDYWPVSVTTPPIVARAGVRPDLPTLIPASKIPVPPAPQVTASRWALAAVPAPAESSVETRSTALAAVPATGTLPLGEALDLNGFPPVSAPPVPAAAATAVPAEPIEVSAPPMPIETVGPNSHQPRLVLAADGESGFLMGTLRKTGAGIVRTGTVTGASIADAFRGVVGAFKKVSPFKDRAHGAMN